MFWSKTAQTKNIRVVFSISKVLTSGIRVEGYFSQEGSVLRERLQSLL